MPLKACFTISVYGLMSFSSAYIRAARSRVCTTPVLYGYQVYVLHLFIFPNMSSVDVNVSKEASKHQVP